MTCEADIEEAVGNVSAALRNGVSRHPRARQLGAYYREELAPAEMEILRDHLALCPECSELVLDLAGFDELATSAEAGEWEDRKSAVWQSLRATLTEPAESDRPLEPVTLDLTASRHRWMLLAALLALAVGAAVWQTLNLGQNREQLASTAERLARAEQALGELELEPQLLVPSLDLFPPGYRRIGAAEAILEIPQRARIFVLQLHIADAGTHADHQLRILRVGGEEVWVGNGLAVTPGGTFRVALPRALMPSGHYRLELYGVGKSSSRQLGHYDLAIEVR